MQAHKLFIPGFYVAESVQEKGLKKCPTFGIKMGVLSQYYINFQPKLSFFHPLLMNFRIYRQIHNFTK